MAHIWELQDGQIVAFEQFMDTFAPTNLGSFRHLDKCETLTVALKYWGLRANKAKCTSGVRSLARLVALCAIPLAIFRSVP